MATFKQIQEYIYNKYGITVRTAWIADLKEKNGISENLHYKNTDLNESQNYCPDNKKKYRRCIYSF